MILKQIVVVMANYTLHPEGTEPEEGKAAIQNVTISKYH